jgi:polysaccharide pyruvyl transferase WcaK-like protein
MKTIVIAGYFGYKNFGDELILFSILQELEKISKKLRIIVLSGNRKYTTKMHSVETVHRFNPISVFISIAKCNILIMSGGLFQDKTSKRSLLYYLSLIKLAKILKKKVFLWSVGIGPVTSKKMKEIMIKTFSKVDRITVRDELSFSILKEHGLPAVLVADTAFNLRLPKLPEKEKIKKLLKMKDSNLPIIGIVQTSFVGSDIITEIKNYKSDFNIYHIKSSIDSIFKTISEIAIVDILISKRLHHLIIATMFNIPVIGVDVDPKIKEFLYELNEKEAIMPYNTNQEELIEKIHQIENKKYNINFFYSRAGKIIEEFKSLYQS